MLCAKSYDIEPRYNGTWWYLAWTEQLTSVAGVVGFFVASLDRVLNKQSIVRPNMEWIKLVKFGSSLVIEYIPLCVHPTRGTEENVGFRPSHLVDQSYGWRDPWVGLQWAVEAGVDNKVEHIPSWKRQDLERFPHYWPFYKEVISDRWSQPQSTDIAELWYFICC